MGSCDSLMNSSKFKIRHEIEDKIIRNVHGELDFYAANDLEDMIN